MTIHTISLIDGAPADSQRNRSMDSAITTHTVELTGDDLRDLINAIDAQEVLRRDRGNMPLPQNTTRLRARLAVLI